MLWFYLTSNSLQETNSFSAEPTARTLTVTSKIPRKWRHFLKQKGLEAGQRYQGETWGQEEKPWTEREACGQGKKPGDSGRSLGWEDKPGDRGKAWVQEEKPGMGG